MNYLKGIITIVRLPNVLFIGLTQLLCYFFIVKKFTENSHTHIHLTPNLFAILCMSTMFIAAAGYIINDYFDIGIDNVNKPHRVTIEKIFKRRSIILSHIFLNLLALGMLFYICYHELRLRYIFVQLVSIFLLLIYSTTLKRKLIWGNLCIALLTALTLWTVAIYEPNFQTVHWNQAGMKYLWLYMLFAFLITSIREIVKDIEDIKGDTTLLCKTIPLVWGINTAKKIIYVLVAILIILMTTSFFITLHNIPQQLFLMLFVIIPLCITLYKLYHAEHSKDFGNVSLYIKIITVMGIISISFI
ncbi:MAG: geranylgeranylglycerol-phosphate geranylgeranyltransferase [Chitinophagaceae bacterium]